jgi:hypothetical protein
MTFINLAERARDGKLTVEEVKAATKDKLEEDKYVGFMVLFWASNKCGIDVVEGILDKGVNIDEQSTVSIVVIYY